MRTRDLQPAAGATERIIAGRRRRRNRQAVQPSRGLAHRQDHPHEPPPRAAGNHPFGLCRADRSSGCSSAHARSVRQLLQLPLWGPGSPSTRSPRGTMRPWESTNSASGTMPRRPVQSPSLVDIDGRVRLTHFAGAISENAASPRLGGAVRIPQLSWVLRGLWGEYYQAPPRSTATARCVISPFLRVWESFRSEASATTITSSG